MGSLDLQRQDLLRGICIRPWEKDRKLVYADFLESELDEIDRANLIRVQLELTDLRNAIKELGPCNCAGRDPTGCARCRRGKKEGFWKRRSELNKAEFDLLTAQGQEWTAELGLSNCYWPNLDDAMTGGKIDGKHVMIEWANGFPYCITCEAETWLKYGKRWIETNPVVLGQLTGKRPGWIGGYFDWEIGDWKNFRDCLPEGIFDRLPYDDPDGQYQKTQTQWWHKNEEKAKDFAWRAAVAWARKEAGLNVKCEKCKGRGWHLSSDIGCPNQTCGPCQGYGYVLAEV